MKLFPRKRFHMGAEIPLKRWNWSGNYNYYKIPGVYTGLQLTIKIFPIIASPYIQLNHANYCKTCLWFADNHGEKKKGILWHNKYLLHLSRRKCNWKMVTNCEYTQGCQVSCAHNTQKLWFIEIVSNKLQPPIHYMQGMVVVLFVG